MIGIAVVLVVIGTLMSWSKNQRIKRYGNRMYTVGVIGVLIAILVLIAMMLMEA